MTDPARPTGKRPATPDAVDEELTYHVDRTVAALVEAGWSAEAARQEAARRFGDAARWREKILSVHQEGALRMARTTYGISETAALLPRLWSAVGRDLAFAWRSLRHSTGLTAVTIATLALGLGGTVTMFAAVNAAFLAPLPFPEEQALVKVYQANERRSDVAVPLEVALDWSRDSRSLTAIGAYLYGITANVQSEGDATRARLARVTRPFFHATGIAPARGRIFSDEDLALGAAPVVVIGHQLAQRLFGATGDPLKETLRIDGHTVPVVGVMPPGFSFPGNTDLWTAIEPGGPAAYGSRTAHNFNVIGRLGPGATIASAQAELTRLSDEQAALFPEMAAEGLRPNVVPLRVDLVGTQGQMVWIGLAAVLCVLLVACVNVANLMLARNLTREAETGIRLALGAGRGAIVRLVMVESLTLATGGALLGLIVGLWGTNLVGALAPDSVTSGRPLVIDGRVVALTVLATFAAGLLCGVLPALRTSRVDPRAALSEGGRAVAGSPRRLMNALVGIEVALAFVLLSSAGVLARSHAQLEAVDSGFRTDGLLLARFSLGSLPESPYGTPDARRAFFERLEAEVSTVPGLRAMALAAIMPPGFSPNGRFVIEGRPDAGQAHFRLVGGDYFRVMRIPIRRGRVFTAEDTAAVPQVAVINESLAALAFPDVDPIGQVVSMPGMDGGSGVATIVGIVADVRHRGPTQPAVAEAYFSYRQRPWRTYAMTLVVDSSAALPAGTDAIRAKARLVDAGIPPEFQTIEATMAPFVDPSAFRSRLLVVVAAVALLLAVVGIAGVVSHGAARRQREMGIRAALGAPPGTIVRLVIRAGLWPVGVGALLGLFGALTVGRFLRTFVFEVSAYDPAVMTASALALLATGLLASWWPARRTAKIDPASVLRA